MGRLVSILGLAVLSFTIGCTSSSPSTGPAPVAQVTPVLESAPDDEPGIALVRIDANGNADPETLELTDYKKKQTIVLWVTECNAEKLKINFKKSCDLEAKPADVSDPACTGPYCAMDARRLGQLARKTTLCYGVTLKLPGKDEFTKDPKLIVHP